MAKTQCLAEGGESLESPKPELERDSNPQGLRVTLINQRKASVRGRRHATRKTFEQKVKSSLLEYLTLLMAVAGAVGDTVWILNFGD